MVNPTFANGYNLPKGKVVAVLRDFIGQTQQIGGSCKFDLEIGTGDQIELLIFNHLDNTSRKFSDVNGVLILDDRTMIFSVSPVYGKPGIYRYDCNIGAPPALMVHPELVTVEYPDGTDYFKLKQFDNANRILEYYYAPNVDDIDFLNFIDSIMIKSKELK